MELTTQIKNNALKDFMRKWWLVIILEIIIAFPFGIVFLGSGILGFFAFILAMGLYCIMFIGVRDETFDDRKTIRSVELGFHDKTGYLGKIELKK